MDEIWIDIVGYEGLYQASNIGRIKSLSRVVNCRGEKVAVRKEKILKYQVINSGYKVATLCIDYNKKNVFVHRVIAESFVPNLDSKQEVNHINGIKTDNRAENLEWSTSSQNKIHAYETGLMTSKKFNDKFGANCVKKEVFQYDINGCYIKSFDSLSEAYSSTSISISGISQNANGKRKTAGGFIWLYKQI